MIVQKRTFHKTSSSNGGLNPIFFKSTLISTTTLTRTSSIALNHILYICLTLEFTTFQPCSAMIVKQESRQYWYLKTKSERLFAGFLILPPAITICVWSGLYMNDNPNLLLLHLIGWAGLVSFWRRFMIVEGIALVNDNIQIWNGPIFFGLILVWFKLL